MKYRQCAICGVWFDEDRVIHQRIIHGKRVSYYCDVCINKLISNGGKQNESKQERNKEN